MLARKLGQEVFWEMMRRLTREFVGRYASWIDLQRLSEESAGSSLETFFQQWVRRSGSPEISIEKAILSRSHTSADSLLTLDVRQAEPAYELDLPLRIAHGSGTLDTVVSLNRAVQTVTIPLNVIPLTVELDPDYHVFRRIALEEIVPTTASTRRAKSLVSVMPGPEVAAEYRSVQSQFESRIPSDQRASYLPGAVPAGKLAEHAVLILGNAVRDPLVEAFLSAVEFPVEWFDDGFEYDGEFYDEPGAAVLCTVRHPDVKGAGVTVLYANSETAIPKAANVLMYDRSLVIFMDRLPILRADFENPRIIPVEPGG
jgi:hypothetical protein